MVLDTTLEGIVTRFVIDLGSKDYVFSVASQEKRIESLGKYTVITTNTMRSSRELYEMRESLNGSVVKIEIITRLGQIEDGKCNQVCMERIKLYKIYSKNNKKLESAENLVNFLDRVLGRKKFKIGVPLSLNLGLKN